MSFRGIPYRALSAATIVAALAMFGVITGPASPANAGEPESIHALVNKDRAANGQPPLSRNSQMDRVALDWANQMAASGTMKHNPDYSNQISGGWSSVAENIARGQSDGASMHRAWMDSDGHRGNILGNYTDIGIAFVSAGETTWGVEVFASYPGSVSSAVPSPELTRSRSAAPAPEPEPEPEPEPTTAPAEADEPVAAAPEAPPAGEKLHEKADAAAEEKADVAADRPGTSRDSPIIRPGVGSFASRDRESDSAPRSVAPESELAQTMVALAASKEAPAGGFVLAVLVIGAVLIMRFAERGRRELLGVRRRSS
ncbi:MAG TPA: CAP domain-containing protein [Marisediminicola sp.]|nr:CAP domain-containing protein [Marisediminicola sp.]